MELQKKKVSEIESQVWSASIHCHTSTHLLHFQPSTLSLSLITTLNGAERIGTQE